MSIPVLQAFIKDWNEYNEEGFEGLFCENAVFSIAKAPKAEIREGGETITAFLQSLVSSLRNFYYNKAKAELAEFWGKPVVLMTYYLYSELTGMVEGSVYYLWQFEFTEGKIRHMSLTKSFDVNEVVMFLSQTSSN